MKQTDYHFNGIHPIVLSIRTFAERRFISICHITYTL